MQVTHMRSVLTINYFQTFGAERKIPVDGNFVLAENGSPKQGCLATGPYSGYSDFTFLAFATGESDQVVGKGSLTPIYFRPVTEEAKKFVEECR